MYAGLPRYSLRVRNNSFRNVAALREGIDEAHAQRKKFFVVSNVLPHNAKVRSFLHDMAPVVALKPDALIMADPGLIDMTREAWPDIPVHLSVQANTLNWAAVRFWQKLGISRIILSRELTLDEIAEIRKSDEVMSSASSPFHLPWTSGSMTRAPSLLTHPALHRNPSMG